MAGQESHPGCGQNQPHQNGARAGTRLVGSESTRWMSATDLDGGLDQTNRRIMKVGRIFMVGLTVVMVGLLVRVVQLQTVPPEPIRGLMGSQQRGHALLARRGSLLDRHGRLLSGTRVAKRLFVDPLLIKDPAGFSAQVGRALGYDAGWLEGLIRKNSGRRYVEVDPQLNDWRLAGLSNLRLRGLGSQSHLVRYYPGGALAGQVLGLVGVDGKGLEGLELSFNQELSGWAGRLGYLCDARREPVWVEKTDYEPPIDGEDVRLSLDATIQHIAESELGEACQTFSAQSGQLIVMDPRDGQVLAMANYPGFDPNQYANTGPEQRRNRCVTDAYEPGSTFKPFVWAAALEAGVAEPDEVIDCTDVGYYVSPRGRGLHDVHGHGQITWDQVLIKSSNIGMAIVAQRMGASMIYDAVDAFGFGHVTGSRLLGEASGLVWPLDKWNHYSVTSVPMGQEIGVTGLQMATAFCAIANGGLSVTPKVLAEVEWADGLGAEVRIYERVLSAATADYTRGVLRQVVIEGTGRRADSDLYGIFGKTGTAQVADREQGGYLPDAYVASFVGGAPVDEPQVVVICAIHQPDRTIGYKGGVVAAPVVRRVIEQTLSYLGVQPGLPDHDKLTDEAVLVRHWGE